MVIKNKTAIKQKITGPINLLKQAIEIYKKSFWRFIKMMFIPLLGAIPMVTILLIYELSLFILARASEGVASIGFLIATIALGSLGILSFFLLIYVAFCSQIGMYIILKNLAQKQKTLESFNEARKYFWSYLAICLLSGVFMIIGYMLFIIPGIIISIILIFAAMTLVFEDFHAMSALKRSKELVKNYWWAIFGRTLVFIIAYGIIAIILSVPLLFFEKGSLSYSFWTLSINMVQFVVAPVMMIATYLIYKELSAIKKNSKV